MSFLDNVTTGPQKSARRTFIYGVHGVGKSTAASHWPKPIFLPTENGCNDLDVTRTQLLTSTTDVAAAIKEVIQSDFETIVLDSIDWTEKLVQQKLDAEGFQDAFGRGAVEISKRVGALLRLLDKAILAGKNVVRSAMPRSRPSSTRRTSWSAYQLKLRSTMCGCLEWVENFFAQTEVRTRTNRSD